jgi:hypothetical protein
MSLNGRHRDLDEREEFADRGLITYGISLWGDI